MTNQQQRIMYRILEKKQDVRTGKLLKDIAFGIVPEDIDGVTQYSLYRWVAGVRDVHPLVSSPSIADVYVYLGPANKEGVDAE